MCDLKDDLETRTPIITFRNCFGSKEWRNGNDEAVCNPLTNTNTKILVII